MPIPPFTQPPHRWTANGCYFLSGLLVAQEMESPSNLVSLTSEKHTFMACLPVLFTSGCPQKWGWARVWSPNWKDACMAPATRVPYGKRFTPKPVLPWGSSRGVASPCCFYHADLDISVVVHGDDFTALATDSSLDYFEAELQKFFEVKLKGRIGHEDKDLKQMRVLNRILRVCP